LNEIAKDRGQSLAQLALAWALRDERVSSVLIGASSVAQLENSLDTLAAGPLSDGEKDRIEQVLSC
jgi:L-glyceraldehyde 3-phosphate reductase